MKSKDKQTVFRDKIPIDLLTLDRRINNNIKGRMYTVLEVFQDSVYDYKLYALDSSYIGSFYIFPISLSSDKTSSFESAKKQLSCSMGYGAKNLIWKKYKIEAYCGFKLLEYNDFLVSFYSELELEGATVR